MAFTIYSSDIIGTDTAITLNGVADIAHILEGVTIASTDTTNSTVFITEDDVQVEVDGTIIGNRYTVRSSAEGTVLSIGETGRIVSARDFSADAGIFFNGGSARIFNAGEIRSNQTIAIFLDDTDMQVFNSGSITGVTGVIVGFSGDVGGSVVNSGTISAFGPVDGVLEEFEGRAVYVGNSDVSVVNLAGGLMTSSIVGGSGIIVSDFGNTSGLSILNHGEISAAQGIGIDLSQMSFTYSASIKNFGTITGLDTAIEDSDAGNTFVNGGLIVGDVNMNGGDDVFRSIGNGQVVGLIDGGDGNDKLVGGALEDSIFGGADNDDLRGRAGDDTLDGGFNDDMLNGGTGDDLLSGGNGEDTVKGGAGDDTVGGGNGRDVLIGGAGADVFLFTSVGHSGTGNQRDVVTDFQDGIDILDFSGISGTLTYRGTSGFTGTGGGELRISETGSGNTVVVIDATGNGATDMQVLVTGVIGLTGDDFVL